MHAYLNKCAEELLCFYSIVAGFPLIATSIAGDDEATELGARKLLLPRRGCKRLFRRWFILRVLQSKCCNCAMQKHYNYMMRQN